MARTRREDPVSDRDGSLFKGEGDPRRSRGHPDGCFERTPVEGFKLGTPGRLDGDASRSRGKKGAGKGEHNLRNARLLRQEEEDYLDGEDDRVHLFDCDEDGRRRGGVRNRGYSAGGCAKCEASREASLEAPRERRQDYREPELRVAERRAQGNRTA